MSGYIMVDTRSPKGHKIGVSGIQGTKLSHQDLDLATYIDNSDRGLEHLTIRSNFSTATWHSTRWVTELPILSNEQSHSSSCLLRPHMQTLLSLRQHKHTSLVAQRKPFFPDSFPNNHPFPCNAAHESLYTSLRHSHRAKQTSEQKGQDIYKIIPEPWKFQPRSLSLWSPAVEQIPYALQALQGGVLAYWQV